MPPIRRSTGSTRSEERLLQIAEHSFLDLWSYANVYRDQGKASVGIGNELCDLLVVCGDHVVLFSDKTVAFKETGKLDVDWARWYRRAVKKAADQLIGAERWLDSPERLYLDAECTIPFPLRIPSRQVRKTHLVVTALGAAKTCQRHYGGGTGSLLVFPPLTAAASLSRTTMLPFAVGDIYPDKSFVHVLDEATLELVLGELDTITDFVNYLQKKENFIRSGRLLSAAGEEDLMGYYITRVNAAGEHDFTSPSSGEWSPGEVIALDEGTWEATRRNPQYLAKKYADEVSYLWDELISAFTIHMLAGTTLGLAKDFSLHPADGPFDVRTYEYAVRRMALETRFRRRMLGGRIADAIEKAKPDVRQACVVASEDEPEETAYVFLQLPREISEQFGEYEDYRRTRAKCLYAYCAVVKGRYRLNRVIGIATEPPKFYKGRTSSEDLLMLESEWTPEQMHQAEKLSRDLEILRPATTNLGRLSAKEYPDDHAPSDGSAA